MMLQTRGLGFGPPVYDLLAGQFSAESRAIVEKWRECGWWNAPWYCTGAPGLLIDSCREHEALVSACVSGHYQPPPRPPAPRPPVMDSSGAPSGSNPVDEVVEQSAEDYRRALEEFHRRQAENLPPADASNSIFPSGSTVALIAAGAAVLVLLLKR